MTNNGDVEINTEAMLEGAEAPALLRVASTKSR